MARQRSKRSRIRGTHSCGYGFKKKHRGKGSKAGKGMSGSGKRAGQRRIYLFKYFPDYLGKRGFNSNKEKLQEINLRDVEININNFIKRGKAKKTSEGLEIDLRDFKILSKGNIKEKLIIHAGNFSKKAEEKVKKAGGLIKK